MIDGEGPASALGGLVLVVDEQAAASWLGRPGWVDRIDLELDPRADRAEVRREVEAALEGTEAALFVPGALAGDRRMLDVLGGLHAGFALCGAGELVLGLFLVASILEVSLAGRQRELAVLHALGAGGRLIRRLYLIEAGGLGLAGSVVGIALGWGLATLALGPLQEVISAALIPIAAQRVELGGRAIAEGIAAGVLTALLAALGPTLRVTARPPVEALRESAAGPGEWTSACVRAAIGAALAALGVAGLALGDRLSLGLTPQVERTGILVVFLVGALLAVPLSTALLARALRPIAERIFGVMGRLAASQVALEPVRCGGTVAALAAAVALVFQTAGVIRGNHEAVRGWIDRGIAGDLFVTSGGPLSASGQAVPMPDEVADQIRAASAGLEIVPMRFRSLEWEHAGKSDRLLMLALDARAYHASNTRRHPPLADLDLYRRLIEPGTVLVSENFAALNHVREGDTITLPGASGPASLRVVGTVVDYSCGRGTLIVDRAGTGVAVRGRPGRCVQRVPAPRLTPHTR